MTLQQLRYICEVVQRGLNISSAAAVMNTSQPGISKQVQILEAELGLQIFRRTRNRISGITPLGERVVALARDIVSLAGQIRSIASDLSIEDTGDLIIASSHTQARYVLPDILQRFTTRYPHVRITLRHGDPEQIAELLLASEADIGVTTDTAPRSRGLVLMPCRRFERVLVAPPGHPLLRMPKLTLESLAETPLVSYEQGFTGRTLVLQAFEEAGLNPTIALAASDADVIKRCVEIGLGVAVLTEAAFDARQDIGLRCMPASHLFMPAVTSVAIMRQRHLRTYEYDFISMCSDAWTRARIDELQQGARTEVEEAGHKPLRTSDRESGPALLRDR